MPAVMNTDAVHCPEVDLKGYDKTICKYNYPTMNGKEDYTKMVDFC